MKPYKIYNSWIKSYFIKRINRFTILVRDDKDEILKAYLPNTGRLEEHLIPDNPIFLTENKTAKFNYKAVSTFYQDSYVFLDTIKTNNLFSIFVRKHLIKELNQPILLCNEYIINNHRIDFFIRDVGNNRNLIEIKSCTLCHNGIAMFPDAPSKRALSHLSLLVSSTDDGYKPWIIILVSHKYAKKFIPNLHTDPDFTGALLNSKNLNTLVYRYTMVDPVTVDLDSIKKIELEKENAIKNLTISGSYLLVLKNEENKTIRIGSIGKVYFKKGYYVYIGSALNGLDQRLKRHYNNNKNKRWHIDYICPKPMEIVKSFKIRRKDRIEDRIAKDIMNISDGYIFEFGSSDSSLPSHLFYFQEAPQQKRDFIRIVLNYQTFTETL